MSDTPSPYRGYIASLLQPHLGCDIARLTVEYALLRPSGPCSETCGIYDPNVCRFVRINWRPTIRHADECPMLPGHCAVCGYFAAEPGCVHDTKCIYWTEKPCTNPNICYSTGWEGHICMSMVTERIPGRPAVHWTHTCMRGIVNDLCRLWYRVPVSIRNIMPPFEIVLIGIVIVVAVGGQIWCAIVGANIGSRLANGWQPAPMAELELFHLIAVLGIPLLLSVAIFSSNLVDKVTNTIVAALERRYIANHIITLAVSVLSSMILASSTVLVVRALEYVGMWKTPMSIFGHWIFGWAIGSLVTSERPGLVKCIVTTLIGQAAIMFAIGLLRGICR